MLTHYQCFRNFLQKKYAMECRSREGQSQTSEDHLRHSTNFRRLSFYKLDSTSKQTRSFRSRTMLRVTATHRWKYRTVPTPGLQDLKVKRRRVLPPIILFDALS